MGTEDWVHKGTKLIKNTKKQRLKIWGRGETLKKEVLKRQNKSITKIIKKKKKIYIYMKFALKIGSFFAG